MPLNRNAVVQLLVPVIIAALVSSCTMWNERDWAALQDRSFHFQRFLFTHLGGSSEGAFAVMKHARIAELMPLVERKYGIQADMSEFAAFCAHGGPAGLSATGALMNREFFWKSAAQRGNTIEFEYHVKSDDYDTGGYHYRLILLSGGKVRAFLSGTVRKSDDLYASLAQNLGGSLPPENSAVPPARVSPSSPLSGPAAPPPAGRRQYGEEGRIKDMIDSYIRALAPSERKAFANEMSRFISERKKQP
jgi:hypothetical protein